MSQVDSSGAGGGPDAPSDTPPDRTISPIAGRFGGRMGKAVTVAALVVGCGVFYFATLHRGSARADRTPVEPARQVVAYEPAKTDPRPTLAKPGTNAPQLTPAAAVAGGPTVPAIQPDGTPVAGSPEAQAQARALAVSQRAAELKSIRSAPIMVFSQGGDLAAKPADAPSTPVVPAIRAAASENELDQLRRASSIGVARAARLPNRNFLLVAGATIPCILQTAMDTSTPGYVTCLVPKDVYSDNGAVVLMEKGTKILGEYRSGLRQGQHRLFVLWTRATTPAGIAISLASPASDALGRAGFDGAIDTFFWERFGGALLLSVVDDATTAAASGNNTGTINRLPSDAASIALQNSINIPPVLRKLQGSEVAIFVAQDFDFSGVYDLRPR
jgi:type IV secretion system protein VirB10